MEPFRWLVDYSVYKLANHQNFRQQIKKKEYTCTREGKIVMDSGLIQRFLELLSRKFQSERLYRFRHGVKLNNGMYTPLFMSTFSARYPLLIQLAG